ncbi:sensor histidine kinase, partial [Motilibacter deserti]|nr:histidine kinase [Motilibacter deserti]
LDEGLRALLQATREAALNAAKHGGGATVSVFSEVEPDRAEVFVRDRGPGFDLDGVPEDRLGVRQSILGRMERHGGRAVISSTPGEGTEVQLELPRSAQPAAQNAGGAQ